MRKVGSTAAVVLMRLGILARVLEAKNTIQNPALILPAGGLILDLDFLKGLACVACKMREVPQQATDHLRIRAYSLSTQYLKLLVDPGERDVILTFLVST